MPSLRLIDLDKNAIPDGQVAERGALMFLYIWEFLIFASTFSFITIAGVESAELGANIGAMSFSLSLIFCGVLASPQALPGFWIFMYRVSPLTYLADGMLSTGIANTAVTCASNEYLNFQPANGTCGSYMASYISRVGGYLLDPDATSDCSYCTIRDTNVYLAGVSSNYSRRWRNFGILWAYIVFNVSAALCLYWYFRVPKEAKMAKKAARKAKREEKKQKA